jgi:F420-dependent methylenetetrahydromethanopterin dehydrogenase
MDRSADPAQVTVTVTGSEAPPDPSGLAEMVAEDLRRAVEVDVVYVPITEGSAPAP